MKLFSKKFHHSKSIVGFGLFLTMTPNIFPMSKIIRQISSSSKIQSKEKNQSTQSISRKDSASPSRGQTEQRPNKSKSAPELKSAPEKLLSQEKKQPKGRGFGLSKSLPNLGSATEKKEIDKSSKSTSSLLKKSKSTLKDEQKNPVKMSDLKPASEIKKDADTLKTLRDEVKQHKQKAQTAQKKYDDLSKKYAGSTKESVEKDTMKLLKEKMDLGVENSKLEKKRKSFLDEKGNVKTEHETEHATITKTINTNKATIEQHTESIKQGNKARSEFMAAEKDLKNATDAFAAKKANLKIADTNLTEQTAAEHKKLTEVKARLTKNLKNMEKDPNFETIKDLLKTKKNMGAQDFNVTADAETLKKITSTPEGKKIEKTLEKLRKVKKQEKQLTLAIEQANPSPKDNETQKMLTRVKSGVSANQKSTTSEIHQ